jgi:hypothetical protein
VELDNDTISTTQSERWFEWHKHRRIFVKCYENEEKFVAKKLTVAGVYSTTTQQERNNNEAVAGAALRQSHNNEANDVTKRRQNLRIFGISRKWGEFTATLWLERRFNNDTGVRNRRKNRLEMFVRMDYDDVLTWNRRWAACIIENVGITTCRGQ